MQMTPEQLEPFAAQIADLVAARVNAAAPVQSVRFEQLFTLYFEKHVKTRNRNWKNAHYFYSAHGKRWAKLQVSDITKGAVQEWIDDLGVNSKSSATRAVNTLSAIINFGIRRGYVSCVNPCIGIEKFALASRERFLRPDEIARLNRVLADEPAVMRDFVWISLITGARRGNVLSMEWAEIDSELSIWTIPASKFKTGKTQVIPLSPWAMTILKRRHQLSDGNHWVFPSPRNKANHLVEPKRAWKGILKRAQIDNLRIHDLRRTRGSYLALNGANQYTIAQMLGHADTRSTAVYARLNLQAVRSATEAADERMMDCFAMPVLISAPECVPLAAVSSGTVYAKPTNPHRVKPPIRDRILSPDELPRFMAAVTGLRHQTSTDYFLMLLFTGHARRAVSEMRWESIDMSNAVWQTPKARTCAG